MARYVLTIEQLGEETCWTLVQQAIGMPDAKMRSDFMEEKIAVLLFAQPSLPERLSVTAAVRQMGGSTVYQEDSYKIWDKEFATYQADLMPIFSCYMDCLYLYGVKLADMQDGDPVDLPAINAGSPDAHPVHALADIACMRRVTGNLGNATVAWIGCDNGTLRSLVAATQFFPFTLRIALPPQIDPAPLREAAARHQGKGRAIVADSVEAAMDNANFVMAGCRGELSDHDLGAWTLAPAMLANAAPDARILLGARPFNAIPVAPELLGSQASLLVKQSEFRLRVHKRLLHWVFEG